MLTSLSQDKRGQSAVLGEIIMLSVIVIVASIAGTFALYQYTNQTVAPAASVDFENETAEVIYYEPSDSVEVVKSDEAGDPVDNDKNIFIIDDRYAYTTGTFAFGGTAYRIDSVDRRGTGHTYYIRGADKGDNVIPENLPTSPGYTNVELVYMTVTSLERADSVGLVYQDTRQTELTQISDEAVVVGPNDGDEFFMYATYQGVQEYKQQYTYRDA